MTDVFNSVFGSIEAFVYRCRNDKDYTMEYLAGAVEPLIGYSPSDLLGNAVVSYVGLTIEDDVDRVFAEVDRCIERSEPWDVFYHLTHKDGRIVPVRERGCAVFKDGELAYLQGMIAGAKAESELITSTEDMLEATKSQNKEIKDLTERILGSLRSLHILSINARVEAARSGDAGRGFTVVAEEMKRLSDLNSEWADQIQKKIST